ALMKDDATKSIREKSGLLQDRIKPLVNEDRRLQKMEESFNREIDELKLKKVRGRDQVRINERISTLSDYVSLMHQHRAKLYSAKAVLEERIARLDDLQKVNQDMQMQSKYKDVRGKYYYIKDGMGEADLVLKDVQKEIDKANA